MGVRSLFHHMTHFVQFCFKLIYQQIHIPNEQKKQPTRVSKCLLHYKKHTI